MTDNIQRGSRGPAPSWNLGRTRSIRVPIILVDTLLQIARQLDEGQEAESVVVMAKEEKKVIYKSCG